jgi:hypothetical protein
MAATALLVTVLAAAANRVGPLFGGMLAALPVLASVLAVFTHRQQGSAALIVFLRGMLAGMVGFLAFCQVVALLIVGLGVWQALSAATVVAIAVQAITVRVPSYSSAPDLQV